MFPKWYDKWVAENPKDIYGPAILIGVLGGAVLFAALLVTWGRPFAVEAAQTGPRGTGMSVTKFVAANATPDPTIALYYTEPPIIPTGGEALAGEIYENVQVLGDLTEDNFTRLMNAITLWVAPEQGCAYCHGDGGIETYGADDLYTKVVARRMIQMTQNLNENWSGHVNVSGQAGVNCFSCHRGQPVPTNVWFRIAPVVDAMAGWGAVQNRATVQSQYTSLPSDALEKYLLDGEEIAVHDLESRVPGGPADEGYRTWQHTERTFSLMNYFANSLNVNCVFCHNSRAFYDVAQNTPQWAQAQLGIAMVLELNNDYMLPLQDVLPPERLGPVHADVPKTACATCHKGYQKPLGGMDMLADWPELAASGPPVYQ
jgi:photosynthetic reaction center cytochrome c subunit